MSLFMTHKLWVKNRRNELCKRRHSQYIRDSPGALIRKVQCESWLVWWLHHYKCITGVLIVFIISHSKLKEAVHIPCLKKAISQVVFSFWHWAVLVQVVLILAKTYRCELDKLTENIDIQWLFWKKWQFSDTAEVNKS